MKQKKILRIFVKRTAMTPDDGRVLIGSPGLFIPEHDEIHISILFTWDLERGRELQDAWGSVTDRPVKIGGPALGNPGGEFNPGIYLKKGVTITSRGCPHKCRFCFVPQREGQLRELEIRPGNIIQDNNLLSCSDKHISKVFHMLKNEKSISFRGGLEPGRITAQRAEDLRGLRIKSLWLSCDLPGDIRRLGKAVDILKRAGFTRDFLRCYVLIGDDFAENENRLREVYKMGCLPFAQLYQGEKRAEYSLEWRRFSKLWSRPALYKNLIKREAKKV